MESFGCKLITVQLVPSNLTVFFGLLQRGAFLAYFGLSEYVCGCYHCMKCCFFSVCVLVQSETVSNFVFFFV